MGKAYARQARNKQLEIDAAEIRIRAERRLGEMLREQPKAAGTRGQLKGRDSSGGSLAEPPENNSPTLSDLGIDKKLSMNSQALASIPEADFEQTLAQHREEQEKHPPGPDPSIVTRDLPPTLEDMGISYDLSSRAQSIASIPEADFEQTLAQHREEQEAVTSRSGSFWQIGPMRA